MGFIPKEKKKALTKKADADIKLNGVLEVLDGPIIRGLIELIDVIVKNEHHQAFVMDVIDNYLDSED